MIDIQKILDQIDPQDIQNIKDGVADFYEGVSDFFDDLEKNFQKAMQEPCHFEEQQGGDEYCGLNGINDLSSGTKSPVNVVY